MVVGEPPAGGHATCRRKAAASGPVARSDGDGPRGEGAEKARRRPGAAAAKGYGRGGSWPIVSYEVSWAILRLCRSAPE
ncbi:hypothetical protein GCM10010517_80870 [Streptosporangium fragile]|uniref:Uncharacterized protein n=1 Tax=Streptosporangium fragile TaxID=46186 RepID=A0ABN3WGF5_9ACTN